MIQIIKSMLDNDLYKFSMGYSYMKLYPDAEGEFEFKDRNNTEYSEYDVRKLREAFMQLGDVKLTREEKHWAIAHIKYIPRFYWEWLSSFHFDPNKINVWLDEDHHLHITVRDKLYKVTLYEVPILYIVSGCHNQLFSINMDEVMKRLEAKVAMSNEHMLYFSEFGTRRRFSFEVQDKVVGYLKDNAKYCAGTSNVYLAMKYDLKPIGTVAHEYIMFHGALYGYRQANYLSYEDWVKTYDGNLGIALTDTYTADAFFNNFSLKQAKLFDGLRQDSGDEREFVDKAINYYRNRGIDPMSKTIVFSNALDMPKYKSLVEFCKGKIKCSAGIGTNLTNDTGFPPMNIVMKLMKCRMNENQEWCDCIKVSDDTGKVMGDSFEIQKCFHDLNISK